MKSNNHLIDEFIMTERRRLRYVGIEVNLVDSPSVGYGGTECNGYFVDVPSPYLTVATGKSYEEWFPIFIHESCHADQFLEQAPCWNNKIGTVEPMTILDLWLEHHIELNPLQLSTTIQGALLVELDCEKRSVAKYEMHRLPFDRDEYIQKANSYVYFYLMLGQTREWYPSGKAPYIIPELWQAMPTEFLDSYEYIPSNLKSIFEKHYGNKIKTIDT